MRKYGMNKALSGIFIGSFDLLTGIRLCHQKQFKELTEQQIDDIIKISLSNVHRQEQKYFENFSISTIEIECYQLIITNAVFNISITKNKYAYYSVGLIFDSKEIRKNEHLTEMFIFWTKILAYNVKNILLQSNSKQEVTNIDYSSLDDLIERISDECSTLTQSQIDNLLSFDIIKPFDQNFYATALTSHLQTQMTTVIELPSFDDNDVQNNSISSNSNKLQVQQNPTKTKSNPKNSKTQTPKSTSIKDSESIITFQSTTSKFNDLFCFLAHFTLPSQLELSSLEVKSYPTPGLFLQCVCSQKVAPEEFLSISPRPTTWIRLQNMKIYRTNEKLFSEQYKNAIQSNLYTSNESETTVSPYLRPFLSISSKLKKDQINKLIVLTLNNNNNYSQWAFSTVSLIKESPKILKKMTTEQCFSSLIKLALTFIAIKNDKLGLNNENNEFLSLEQINDIQKNELELETNEDLLMVISISQIYDKNTYKQMQLFLANNNKVI